MTVFHLKRSDASARLRVCVGFLAVWLALVSPAQAAGPILVLIGAPGSGKATQAAMLKSERGMNVIFADDLIANNPEAFEKSRTSAIAGFDPHLDPAMNGLIAAAIAAADLSKGLVLAGYPASKAQGDFLVALQEKLNLPKAIVINLVVSDNEARKRLKKDKVPDIEQQLKNYHRELDFARAYFPQADIRDVNGNPKPAKVAADIRKLLEK